VTPEQHARSKQAFLLACELPPGERAAKLPELCGGDAAVIADVSSLLAAYDVLPPDTPPPTTKFGSPRKRPVEPLFPPGTVLSERYRVVAKLGHGGMGEIYRADDLVLGEPVALKFLHLEAGASKEMLLNELKLARQVSHPNVCRLFDVGEAGGRLFLSMEYVDGEDLAALLQRIGRLPEDRAVILARQLFSGLAAAHAKGVLHCDLKPANIMIDGRGNARITDFGIARLEAPAEESGILAAGTPAYMAPEQLVGQQATAKSDVYSLGLVLFEMATGVHPFADRSRQRMIEAHLKRHPPPPSTLAPDIDPTLERIIQQSLEKEPRDRPASALAVAAALSTGDPLELALSIGETPPPELLAQARSSDALQPRRALVWCGAIALLLLAMLLTAEPARRFHQAGLKLPPEVMAEKAREILREFGWTQEAEHEAFGFLQGEQVGGRDEKPAPATGQVLFWYRRSSAALVPSDLAQLVFEGVRTGPYDPPTALHGGDALVLLHPAGWLDHLELRPQREPGQQLELGKPTDYAPVLRAAGLDPQRFETRKSMIMPPFFADDGAFLSGSSEERPDLPLQIRAAGFQGKPVYFRLQPAVPEQKAAEETPFWGGFFADFYDWYDLFYVFGAFGAMPLARFNLRRGRGDRRGAWRLAIFVFCLKMAIFLFDGIFVLELRTQWAILNLQVGQSLLEAALAWIFYLAIEPYVRRIWPHTLISWTRLLAGRWQDALLARHVLVGILFGALWMVLAHFDPLLPSWLSLPYKLEPVAAAPFNSALSAGTALATTANQALLAVYNSVFSLLLLVLLRFVCRRADLATAVYIAAASFLYSHAGAHSLLSLVTIGLVLAAGEAWLLARHGLVSLTAATFTFGLLSHFPMTLDRGSWYASAGYFALFVLAIATVWAARQSLDPPRRRVLVARTEFAE
jgi:hypothetical protein